METIIEAAGLEITDISIAKGTISLVVRNLSDRLRENYERYGFLIFDKKGEKSVIVLESSTEPYYKKENKQ